MAALSFGILISLILLEPTRGSMIEENLYPMIQKHLEKKLGYYPVRIAPSVSIRGYKPDVTGIKGKRVVTIEAKLGFDSKSLMEAVTQAKVYSIGSTHAYVAFPLSAWTDGDNQLRNLCTDLCKNEGIGVYLIDENNESLREELDSKLSRYINLDDYENTIEQLEGDKELSLYNTYPEYVRDVCIYIQHLQDPLIEERLIQNLMKDFDNQYWTVKSGARGIPEEAKVENRVIDAVKGTLELGLTRYESLLHEEEEIKRISLTRNGRLLVSLCTKGIDYKLPVPLNDFVRVFFSTYLLQFPIINIALDILEKLGKEVLFGQSVCSCGFSSYDLKKFRVGEEGLICPKCKQNVDAGFSHQLLLEYGDKECYHELKFTRTLSDTPLLLFDFGKISRWGSIKIKQ